MQTLLRSDARHIEQLREKYSLLDPHQTFFVYPVAVQASPTGQNIFVFDQGRPLSLIKNIRHWPKDALCLVESLSQVMRGLLALHEKFGSHNNLSINTVSAREPPNECLSNVKIQLIDHSFFAAPWPNTQRQTYKAFFQEASGYLGTYTVLPMIALQRYLDQGLEGLPEQLEYAQNYPRYQPNRSKWSFSNENILWDANKCLRALQQLDALDHKDPQEASKAVRYALSQGDTFQFQRLCLEWVPTVFQRLEKNTHVNMLELNQLHDQLKAFFNKIGNYVQDELIFVHAKHAPWSAWVSEYTAIFSKQVFTNDENFTNK